MAGARVRHEWYGDRAQAKLRAAEKGALVKVGSRIIGKAVPRAPILTGALRRSLRFDPPEDTPSGVTMLLGSFDIGYALYQERGTSRIPGKFYLKRSIDEEVPNLPAVLKDELK